MHSPQEKRQAEEERLRKAKEVDYLAPYLARLGEPSTLTVGDVDQLKGDCLKDLRTRLVDLANIIQSRFEMVGKMQGCRCVRIACARTCVCVVVIAMTVYKVVHYLV